MAQIKIKGDQHRYDVRDQQCIGRECLNLHAVAMRSPTTSGTRLTGYTHCCARREYHNCPNPVPEFDRKLAAQRRKDGMKTL